MDSIDRGMAMLPGHEMIWAVVVEVPLGQRCSLDPAATSPGPATPADATLGVQGGVVPVPGSLTSGSASS